MYCNYYMEVFEGKITNQVWLTNNNIIATIYQNIQGGQKVVLLHSLNVCIYYCILCESNLVKVLIFVSCMLKS